MVAIGNPDLPWAQEAALQQRWFECSASVRDIMRSEDHQARHLARTIHRQPHVLPAVTLTTRHRSQKLVHQGWHKVRHKVGTRLRLARRPTPHFGLLGLFPCVAKELENVPSDVENRLVCLGRMTHSMILLARGRKIIDFAALATSRSRILHARARKIVEFVCLGDISNHDFSCQG